LRILAQQGYGKGRYIEEGIKDGSLRGAILSPRDEEPAALTSFVKHLAEDGLEFVAIDPQFYAFTIADGRLRHLERYPFSPGFLTRRSFSSSTELRAFSSDALKYQAHLPVTHLISPAVALTDLRDSNSQIYVTMAQESIRWHSKKKQKPLLLSLILNESALQSSDAIDEFLDVITSWDYHGVYLCVQATTSAYPATLSAAALANLLYLVHVLTTLNDYLVVFGFADFNALLLGAAGASYAASGWYNSLKQFSLNRFVPSKGGSRPRPRYPSIPLLAPILVEPELSEIVDLGFGEYALSDLDLDDQLSDEVSGAMWPALVSYRANVAALAGLGESLRRAGRNTQTRLDSVIDRIERARSSYQYLATEGVTFQTRFGFLNTWQEAIEQFLDRIR